MVRAEEHKKEKILKDEGGSKSWHEGKEETTTSIHYRHLGKVEIWKGGDI